MNGSAQESYLFIVFLSIQIIDQVIEVISASRSWINWYPVAASSCWRGTRTIGARQAAQALTPETRGSIEPVQLIFGKTLPLCLRRFLPGGCPTAIAPATSATPDRSRSLPGTQCYPGSDLSSGRDLFLFMYVNIAISVFFNHRGAQL